MKLALVSLTTLFALTAHAAAPDGLTLATKNGCLACHAVDHKIVGPAYKDVAAKYRGNKEAPAKLAAKVKAGGSGVWGAVPMPPQAISAADLTTVLTWVLAQ